MNSRRAFLASFVGLAAVGCERASSTPRAVATAPRGVTPTPARPPVAPAAPAEPALDPIVVPPTDPGFFGADDAPVRTALRDAPIAAIKKGGGGRSLGFKITLEGGQIGYFKPDQAIDFTHYWAELGAYYLDRELGFGRVPPAIGRVMDWGRLMNHAQTDPRLAEMRPRRNGTIRGAFIAWVHEGPTILPLGRGWERWVRVDGPLAFSPYVPPRMQVEGQVADAAFDAPAVPREPARAGELSDLLVFDYLIQNADRWGSENANVRTRGPGGPLLFFDNGAGFWPGDQRMPVMERRLTSVQRFRRSTVDALRRFDVRALGRRMAADPLTPVLTEPMLAGLETRVGVVLAHVDAMVGRFGDRAYLDV